MLYPDGGFEKQGGGFCGNVEENPVRALVGRGRSEVEERGFPRVGGIGENGEEAGALAETSGEVGRAPPGRRLCQLSSCGGMTELRFPVGDVSLEEEGLLVFAQQLSQVLLCHPIQSLMHEKMIYEGEEMGVSAAWKWGSVPGVSEPREWHGWVEKGESRIVLV